MNLPTTNDLSIAAVERETGLSKDTLRVWERRYHFPSPGRDAYGERSYPPDQVEQLRLIRALMDHGHRPGKIVGLDIARLRELAEGSRMRAAESAAPVGDPVALQRYLGLCRAHQTDALRRELSQALVREGVYRFVIEVVGPLNTLVGASWANGTIAVFEEHLYTECMQAVMRQAIASIPLVTPAANAARRPRILLATIPQEQHGLGLLMSEAIFALEGAHCVSLGTQAPVLEIARAARAQAADIVGLSFAASARAVPVLEALRDLRAELPPQIEIWAGGRCAALRRGGEYARLLDLEEIRAALQDWRARQPN